MIEQSDIREVLNKPALHGRQLAVGLALLEPRLRMQLEESGVFSSLVNEIREKPFESICTDRGLDLLKRQHDAGAKDSKDPRSKRAVSDNVPNHSDNPLLQIEQDKLGRAAFARYLVNRITETPFCDGAYAIHLCGPWGSGKSSVLNFLRSEMEGNGTDASGEKSGGANRKKWIVVEYNAWRHQHLTPPWWSLYNQIFIRMKKTMRFRHIVNEYWWRFLSGQPLYILALIAAVWIMVLIFPLIKVGDGNALWGETADNIGKAIAFITTIAGGIVGFTRSLLSSSHKAAQGYEESVQNPMNGILNRFKKVLKSLPEDTRLAVFIDDLDRCQSEYVVSLLEGIQTLFRNGSILFVVAADRKWLNSCYEQIYEKFAPTVKEPGKPLGTLFLEKAFQLCTPMPGLPGAVKDAYWNYLLQLKSGPALAGKEEARKKARESLRTIKEETEVHDLVERSAVMPIQEQIALREEAVVRMAAPELADKTEHALRHFYPFLDDNPRAMKRFVNSYNVYRALATLSFIDIDRDDLAQWAIICMRWPRLAEELSKNPSLIAAAGKGSGPADPEINALLKDDAVNSVITGTIDGKSITSPLTETVIGEFAALYR